MTIIRYQPHHKLNNTTSFYKGSKQGIPFPDAFLKGVGRGLDKGMKLFTLIKGPEALAGLVSSSRNKYMVIHIYAHLILKSEKGNSY